MSERPFPLETAEQRAKRHWHNGRVSLKIRDENTTHVIQSQGQSPPINQPNLHIHKFRRVMREIFNEKKSDIITHYIASVKSEKHRLLVEKLKRMERDNA
jgi:hypothetical protein